MPAKPTPNLADLRSQARLTYRYWPIYLHLRLREVEQHLTAAERQALAGPPSNLAVLVQYGLWKAEESVPKQLEVSGLAWPAAELCFFRVGPCLSAKGFLKAFVSLDAVAADAGIVQRLELLRVRTEDAASLDIIRNRVS
jgi:hypothetical protein